MLCNSPFEIIAMRKKIIKQVIPEERKPDAEWLDVEKIAIVEVSSEDDSFPIESALLPGNDHGWRASTPGKQTIRLGFNPPQEIQKVLIVFEDRERTRTQEYVLSYSSDGGKSYCEISRQQWNFNPDNATCESETHEVNLHGITTIELMINPDISNEDTMATLKQLRLASH